MAVSCEQNDIGNNSYEKNPNLTNTLRTQPGSTKSFHNLQSHLLSTLVTPKLNLVIDTGMEVIIDKSVEVQSIMIKHGGVLRCDETIAAPIINLKTNNIMVHGDFVCGSESNPYDKKLNILLTHNPNRDPRLYIPGQQNENLSGVMYRAIHVMGGKLKLIGTQVKSGWDYIAGTLEVDSNLLTVMKPTGESTFADGWQVGDKIVVGPTGFDPEQAETFTIVRVDKNKYPNKIEFMLDHRAQFRHEGTVETLNTQSMGEVVLNERAEVANLSRNIRILPFEKVPGEIDNFNVPYDQVGGHVMIMDLYDGNGHKVRDGEAYIDSVEFYRMGQAGIMARYPFHWHKSQNVNGQYIKNSSIHESFQRCITVHQTNYAEVRNNVCYKFKGHGFFLEDGNETKNKIVRNLAVLSQKPSQGKILLSSEDWLPAPGQNDPNINRGGNQFGRFHAVASFWISNPDNEVTWNVASGSVGTGFWNAFKDEFKGIDDVVVKPNRTPTLKFWHNTAHAAIVGMTWDGAEKRNGLESAPEILALNPDSKKITNSHYAPEGGQVPYYRGLRVFKNRATGIYFRSNTNILENLIAADNGWSLWNAYNNIVKNSVIMGKSYNSSDGIYADLASLPGQRRNFRAGVIIYDGPFEIHNTDFLNFDTAEYSVNYTYYYDIPMMSIGGAQKFVNVTSGLHFKPRPYQKAYLFDENTTYNSSTESGAHILGESMIRDLDGTLIGNQGGGYLTGKTSLGITDQLDCEDGGEVFHNYKICPQTVKENAVINMRIKSIGYGQETFNPYVVRRKSDGKLNLEKEFWSQALNGELRNIKYNISTDPEEVYELLTDKEFLEIIRPANDPKNGHFLEASLSSEMNGDNSNFNTALIKYVSYGNNCILENSTRKLSLHQLKESRETAYYRNGTDLYVKLIPNRKFNFMNNSPEQRAKTYLTYVNNTQYRHRISCEMSSVVSHVAGRIDSVIYNVNSTPFTRVFGWACNVRRKNPAKVRVQVKKPNTPPINITGELLVNLPAEPAINFKCASMELDTARFQIDIPNEILKAYPDSFISVLGVSTTTGGQNSYLMRSGDFPAVNSSAR